MPSFEINKHFEGTDVYQATVEAVKYRQEDAYFVFYGDASLTKKVLTVSAAVVTTIDTVDPE